MNSRKFWFYGLWTLPIDLIIFLAMRSFLIGLKSFQYINTGMDVKATLTAGQNITCLLLSIIPSAVVFTTNFIRYMNGETEFIPFASNKVTTISRDKKMAMEAQDDAALPYLSKKPDGITIGEMNHKYFRIPINPNNILHALIVGSPGSGKSSTLLNGLISNFQFPFLSSRMTVFAIDVKPELQRKSVVIDPKGVTVRVLNPSSLSDVYFGWNAFYGLNEYSSDDAVEARMDKISRSLIVSDGKSENEIFYATARNLMVAFLMYGFFLEDDFMDSMLRLMTVPLQDLIAQIILDKEMISCHPRLNTILRSYSGDETEMLKDAENTMRENLRIFNNESVKYFFKGNPRKVNPTDLVHGTSIFLSIPDNLLHQYRSLFNMITQQVLEYLSSIPERDRADSNVPVIWLLIDEFGSLGKMQIEEPLARLRSRKVMIWLCVQGLSQLDKTYGKDGRRVIMDNCDCTLVLSSKDPEANSIFAGMAGKYRETKISNHRNGITKINSHSQNVSFEYRDIFESSDFASLRKGNKLFCYIDGDYFYIDKLPYFKIEQFKEASDDVKRMNDRMLP